MSETYYAVFDGDGGFVEGLFLTVADAEQWLATFPLHDMLDQDGEFVEQDIRFRDGALLINIKTPGIFEIRRRPTEDLVIAAVIEDDHHCAGDHAGEEPAAPGVDTGSSAGTGRQSVRSNQSRSIRTRNIAKFRKCMRCSESYLPELSAEAANAAADCQQNGWCQDCRARDEPETEDLTSLVERMLRGVMPK
jgi:hypothetical protein